MKNRRREQGSIIQRGPERWSVVIDQGKDEKGNRIRKWHTVSGGKRDAERELRRLLAEMDAGTYVPPSKLTVGEFLDRWLSDYARVKVNPKVFERYQEIVRLHLAPTLGYHQLEKLQPLQ